MHSDPDVTDVVGLMAERGGVVARPELCALVGRRAVDRAVREKRVVVLRRGLLGLPSLDEAVRRAHESGGVLCLESAALYHGWPVKEVPTRPHIVLARGRKVPEEIAAKAVWHRLDLGPDDSCDGVATSRELTLEQCLRRLPRDAALAVADSALRDGEQHILARVVASARGPGSTRIREIGGRARKEAANPFESVLRDICDRIEGLHVEPQVLITSVDPWVRPDLVDRDLRVVVEADSFEWHGDRAALRRDARRYDLLVADGWLVLRFAWEDVMHDQDFIERVLRAAVALASARTHRSTQARSTRCGAA